MAHALYIFTPWCVLYSTPKTFCPLHTVYASFGMENHHNFPVYTLLKLSTWCCVKNNCKVFFQRYGHLPPNTLQTNYFIAVYWVFGWLSVTNYDKSLCLQSTPGLSVIIHRWRNQVFLAFSAIKQQVPLSRLIFKPAWTYLQVDVSYFPVNFLYFDPVDTLFQRYSV